MPYGTQRGLARRIRQRAARSEQHVEHRALIDAVDDRLDARRVAVGVAQRGDRQRHVARVPTTRRAPRPRRAHASRPPSARSSWPPVARAAPTAELQAHALRPAQSRGAKRSRALGAGLEQAQRRDQRFDSPTPRSRPRSSATWRSALGLDRSARAIASTHAARGAARTSWPSSTSCSRVGRSDQRDARRARARALRPRPLIQSSATSGSAASSIACAARRHSTASSALSHMIRTAMRRPGDARDLDAEAESRAANCTLSRTGCANSRAIARRAGRAGGSWLAARCEPVDGAGRSPGRRAPATAGLAEPPTTPPARDALRARHGALPRAPLPRGDPRVSSCRSPRVPNADAVVQHRRAPTSSSARSALAVRALPAVPARPCRRARCRRGASSASPSSTRTRATPAGAASAGAAPARSRSTRARSRSAACCSTASSWGRRRSSACSSVDAGRAIGSRSAGRITSRFAPRSRSSPAPSAPPTWSCGRARAARPAADAARPWTWIAAGASAGALLAERRARARCARSARRAASRRDARRSRRSRPTSRSVPASALAIGAALLYFVEDRGAEHAVARTRAQQRAVGERRPCLTCDARPIA